MTSEIVKDSIETLTNDLTARQLSSRTNRGKVRKGSFNILLVWFNLFKFIIKLPFYYRCCRFECYRSYNTI
jgi:hypothetical protein